MLRKSLGLVVLLSVGGVMAADKDKDKELKKEPGIKATLVKADVDRKMLVVMMDGKKAEYEVTKDVKFVGPRGGVSKEGLKDDRLTPGAELKLVLDGKKIKEVHLPVRSSKKPDDKKDKDKPKG